MEENSLSPCLQVKSEILDDQNNVEISVDSNTPHDNAKKLYKHYSSHIVPERFADIDDDEMNNLEFVQHKKSTTKVYNYQVSIFHKFLRKKDLSPDDFHTSSKEKIFQILKEYLASTRKEDGTFFKLNSYNQLVWAISKYVHQKTGYKLLEDERVKNVRSNVRKQIMEAGKGLTNHKDPIAPNDLVTLYNSFDPSYPEGLQSMVFFYIMYLTVLNRQGQQNIREQTKSTFQIYQDSDGFKYIEQVQSELDTNNDEFSSIEATTGQVRIYQFSPESDKCPVKAFEKYIGLLHVDCDLLWPKPLVKNVLNKPWYSTSPIGHNKLARMIPSMCQKAGIKHYTNNCVRAKTLTILSQKGVSESHLKRISGHKTDSSVSSNGNTLSETNEIIISNSFSNAPGHKLMDII